jgi:hypothetical protein
MHSFILSCNFEYWRPLDGFLLKAWILCPCILSDIKKDSCCYCTVMKPNIRERWCVCTRVYVVGLFVVLISTISSTLSGPSINHGVLPAIVLAAYSPSHFSPLAAMKPVQYMTDLKVAKDWTLL